LAFLVVQCILYLENTSCNSFFPMVNLGESHWAAHNLGTQSLSSA